MDFFLKSDTYAGLTPSDSILLRHRTGTFHRFGLVPAVGDLLPSSAFYIYRMSQGFLLKSVFREACFDSSLPVPLLWNFPLRVILEDLKARLPVLVESVKSSKGYLDDWKQKEHLRKSLASELHSYVAFFRWYADLREEERRLKIRESELRTEMDRLSARLSDI